MSGTAVLYALLDQNLEREALDLSALLKAENSLPASEEALLLQGLSLYLCPQAYREPVDMTLLNALVEKLSQVDERLIQAVAIGLSVGLCLDFRYKRADEVLVLGFIDEASIQHPVLLSLYKAMSGFVGLKLSKDLPQRKAQRSLENFEASSSALNSKGLVRSSTYIGLIGLKLSKRLMPEMALDMLVLHFRLESQYYGWADLFDFSEDVDLTSPDYTPEELFRQGAYDEWLYGLQACGTKAVNAGDVVGAAAIYKQIADYLLQV